MLGVIMAGGEGSRLRPLTCGLPKPMVPVMNRPVMEYSIDLLVKYGVRKACVTLHYLPNKIVEHFQDGQRFGINMEYFVEDTPLGTAGSVRNASEALREPFVIISGDALTDINLQDAYAFHQRNHAKVTIVLKRVGTPLEYGVVITAPDGRITRFLEKPSWSEVFSDTVNTGIYIIEPEILEKIPVGRRFDFSQDLFPQLLREGVGLYGYVAEGYWCDIGDTAQYVQAHFDLLDGKVKADFHAKKQGSVWMQEGAIMEDGVRIDGPAFVATGARVLGNSVLGQYSIIGAGCECRDVSIKKSILWEGVRCAPGSHIRGAVLCSRTRLGERSNVYENAVIGEDCVIESECEVRPGVKVWPSKRLEHGTTISEDFVWGDSRQKSIFGDLGIRGVLNEDITPEYAAAIGAAFAGVQGGGLLLAHSGGAGSEMLLKSLSTGILSCGYKVFDAGQCAIEALRHSVRELMLSGGVFLEVDRGFVRIRLLDKNGSDIVRSIEKKLENAYHRRDSKRCASEQIPVIQDIHCVEQYYIGHLARALGKASHTLVIGGSVSTVSLLDKIASACGWRCIHIGADAKDVDIQRAIITSSAELAVIINNDDTMDIFDETGTRLSQQAVKALQYYLLCRRYPGTECCLPVHETDELAGFIAGCGGRVRRTKTSMQENMVAVWSINGSTDEKEAAAELLFDRAAFTAFLADTLAQSNKKLSTLAALMPNSTMLHAREVACPAVMKGRVMRALSGAEAVRKDLLDGVKLYQENGWVLVLPHADKPVCRIYSSSFSEEYAQELAISYADLIEKTVHGG